MEILYSRLPLLVRGSPNGVSLIGVSPNGVSPDHLDQMGLVQLRVVQLGVVQMGVDCPPGSHPVVICQSIS